MSRLSCAVVLIAAGLSAVACQKTPEAAADTGDASALQLPKPVPAELPDVLARVNGEEVKKHDFEMLVRNMELGQGPIPAEQRDEVLRGALDRLITYTLLQQEARTRNITVADSEVEAAMSAIRKQFPDEAAFSKALEERSMSAERLRSDTRTDMVISKMLEAEVVSAPAVTDADVREFYDKNPDEFKSSEAIRASHILILVDEKADDATRKKARDAIDGILVRARAGEDFAKLAQAHSQDSSAAQGGDLSFFGRGRMVPPFEEAAFALEPGQISDVVTTQFGYHIIKTTERRPASTVPLEQVSEQIKHFLTEQNKQARADAFIATLKQKSKIEVLI